MMMSFSPKIIYINAPKLTAYIQRIFILYEFFTLHFILFILFGLKMLLFYAPQKSMCKF